MSKQYQVTIANCRDDLVVVTDPTAASARMDSAAGYEVIRSANSDTFMADTGALPTGSDSEPEPGRGSAADSGLTRTLTVPKGSRVRIEGYATKVVDVADFDGTISGRTSRVAGLEGNGAGISPI